MHMSMFMEHCLMTVRMVMPFCDVQDDADGH
jgi:hypothetical protein